MAISNDEVINYLSNLSVIDLIFNEGPQALLYLQKLLTTFESFV
jgi:hypothetical protein